MTYEPAYDDCRVCGAEAPHQWSRRKYPAGTRLAVSCAICNALLELADIGELPRLLAIGFTRALVTEAEINAWRFSRREQFGACMICGHGPANPWPDKQLSMSVLNVHEILNGMGQRQKAEAKAFATLVLCAWCNVYVVVDKSEWPHARQLAVLKQCDPENYSALSFCRLRDPDAQDYVTDAEVSAAGRTGRP